MVLIVAQEISEQVDSNLLFYKIMNVFMQQLKLIFFKSITTGEYFAK